MKRFLLRGMNQVRSATVVMLLGSARARPWQACVSTLTQPESRMLQS